MLPSMTSFIDLCQLQRYPLALCPLVSTGQMGSGRMGFLWFHGGVVNSLSGTPPIRTLLPPHSLFLPHLRQVWWLLRLRRRNGRNTSTWLQITPSPLWPLKPVVSLVHSRWCFFMSSVAVWSRLLGKLNHEPIFFNVSLLPFKGATPPQCWDPLVHSVRSRIEATQPPAFLFLFNLFLLFCFILF